MKDWISWSILFVFILVFGFVEAFQIALLFKSENHGFAIFSIFFEIILLILVEDNIIKIDWENIKILQFFKEKTELFFFKLNKRRCSICGKRTYHFINFQGKIFCSLECYKRKGWN